MADYPGAIPTFPVIDASAGDLKNTPGKEHDAMHNRAFEEIVALATVMGINPTALSDSGVVTQTTVPTTQAQFNDLVCALISRILGHFFLTNPRYNLQNLGTVLSPNRVDEQSVQVPDTVTGGTFTITYAGYVLGPIAFDAAAATLQAGLEAIPAIGAGNVTVNLIGGGSGSPSNFQVLFSNAVIPDLVVNGAGLTGPDSPYDVWWSHTVVGGTGHSHIDDELQGGILTGYAKLNVENHFTEKQFLEHIEIAVDKQVLLNVSWDPVANPPTDTVVFYARRNGAKMQLAARFPTGALVPIVEEA